MCIPVHSPWLPGYTDVVQTVLIILTMLDFFWTDYYIYIYSLLLLVVWVLQELVTKMQFNLQEVYWRKSPVSERWEVLEEAGEYSVVSSKKVLATGVGNPCVKVPGLWSPVSCEQACLSPPVLLSHWLGKPGLSANTTVRGLRGMFSSCPIHTWICLHKYVCLQMDTCVHMGMCVYLC